jgi:hypothetical protein
MTFVGRTALSVETRTNLSTSYFADASARIRVPRTFVFTASTGCISIMGTCLYAAAWYTMDGRWIRRVSSTRAGSLTSPITGTALTEGNLSRISISKSNSGLSAISNITSRAGDKRAILRHSSDPMDPAAPVTITVFPLMFLLNSSVSSLTGSRPRRSWRSTFRRSLTLTFPSIRSPTPGRIRAPAFTSRQCSRMCRRRDGGAEGMAMMISSIR